MTASERLDDWIKQPLRPMAAETLLGVRVVEAEPGRVEGVQTRAHAGSATLGWFGVLADTMSGRGVACALPRGTSLSTVSMHLDLVRAPTAADCASVTASGRVISLDGSWALGRLTVRGERGMPFILGTVRFLVHPEERDTVPATAGAAEGDVPDQPGTDLHAVLGLRTVHAADGRSELSFLPGDEHTNPYPIVHGGLHAGLVDAALTAAVNAPGSGPPLTLLTLDLNFHRPIPVNGEVVGVEGRARQRGRRTALAEGTIRAASGKALTSARGTFGLLS